MKVIWVKRTPEYFCKKGWTGDSPYGPSDKITRFRLDSLGENVVGPFAEGFLVDGDGGTLLSFVAHTAEHTLSSDWNGQYYTPTASEANDRPVVPFVRQSGA